ncbi:MAG: DUF2808 domain-containing protein [Synechococcaceae cyanobacterium SM2_3_1]|nr:DUF2808 domain-containing protein [Synechococcaceae cyanobacterium SM2_3_1]
MNSFLPHFSLVGLVGLLFPLVAPAAVNALVGSDGTIYFEAVPRLLNASATRQLSGVQGSTLRFTIEVPQGAGVPLGQIHLTQDQNFEALRISPDRITAVEGAQFSDSALRVPMRAEVPDFGERQPIEITFDPPLPAGTTVTLGLRPSRTPQTSGVYQFGIVALPAGDQPFEYFLNYGRINFFERDRDRDGIFLVD